MRLTIELKENEAKQFKNMAQREDETYGGLLRKYVLSHGLLDEPNLRMAVRVNYEGGKGFKAIARLTGISKSKVQKIIRELLKEDRKLKKAHISNMPKKFYRRYIKGVKYGERNKRRIRSA